MHYGHFDTVTGGDVGLFRLTDGVFDAPVANLDAGLAWQLGAAHVDDDVEAGDVDRLQTFWKLAIQTDVFVFHHLLGQGLDNLDRMEAGTLGLQDIRTVTAGEALRHWATAGIADAQE